MFPLFQDSTRRTISGVGLALIIWITLGCSSANVLRTIANEIDKVTPTQSTANATQPTDNFIPTPFPTRTAEIVAAATVTPLQVTAEGMPAITATMVVSSPLTPTFIPSPSSTPTRSPNFTITSTTAPTTTPIPAGIALTLKPACVYSGPGTAYEVIRCFQETNVQVVVRGRDARQLWIAITYDQKKAWIQKEYLQLSQDIRSLPVIDAPPLPTPTRSVCTKGNCNCTIKQGETNWIGECRGDVLWYCDGCCIQQLNCAALGGFCGYKNNEDGYVCFVPFFVSGPLWSEPNHWIIGPRSALPPAAWKRILMLDNYVVPQGGPCQN